ncbi:hypothetical protein IQ258_16690, partial [Coleofasciculus sp. LEGE 07081]|nr:hypothetical protein [Coleofasciculus sp. LEGE 07081]
RGAGETRENLPNSQSSEPLKNVLSAISAKGLEFKRVILYKFGEDCNHSVWNLKGLDQKVKVEYFFNKLYVAASRATDYLFVVDSEKGDRQLWQYASDEALLQAMLGHARSKTRWEENVRTITPGTPATARQMREDDPGAIALEFETKGLNAENPGLLRRAKQFYSDMGDRANADFCEAWALKFEGHFCEAGGYFLGLGDSDQAWDCFWQGMCWLELVNWYNLHPQEQAAERFLTLFMAAPPQDLDALHQFASVVLNQKQTINTSEQWTQARQEYANRIEAFLNNPKFKPEQWQQFGEGLAALEFAEPSRFYKLAGDCFYRAQNYEQAIYYWEAGDAMQTPEYFWAKALGVGMPEGLEYLAQAGECDRIIAEWQQAGKPRDRQWLTYVAFALETKKHYQQAFVIYVWLDELVKVKACFDAASLNRPPIKLLKVLFQYLFRRKYWSEAIDAIETYLPIVTGSESRKLDLNFDIIYEISGSDLSPHDLNNQQRQYYVEFIKTQILATPDWYQDLLIQQVGIALEKVGAVTETLSFYEQFVNCIDPELRQFARERWIATQKKQEQYARNQNNLDKARKIYSELLKQSASWAIVPDSVSLAPPLVSRERPRLPLPKSAAAPTFQPQPPTVQEPVIQGLPRGTKVERIEDGIIGFEVRHLAIKVMSSSKQVLITDVLNSRDVRVDWEQCQVNIGEATIDAMGSHQLSFALFTSGYRGILICDKKTPRLELDVQGCQSKILIELR